ncbi:MAG: hypothetical protein IPL23_21710 [Saprospiraceae bacterium]|nr:hypothetical protein [Saprospiraceae bacterium]
MEPAISYDPTQTINSSDANLLVVIQLGYNPMVNHKYHFNCKPSGATQPREAINQMTRAVLIRSS